MSHLGDCLRKNRAIQNMSLQDVADETGITKAHIWVLEAGRAINPCVSTLLQLAVAIEVNPHILFAAALLDQPGVCADKDDAA